MQEPEQQSTRLNLPLPVVKRLRSVGIYCRAELSLEYQAQSNRYIVHGTESGGAIRETGRYVTFCGLEGEPLPQLHPIDSVLPNGLHAIVVVPTLIKVEMFRFKRSYQALLTRHFPSEIVHGRRPSLREEEVWRGVDGFLAADLLGKEKELAGTISPDFFSRSGEKLEIPSRFQAVLQAITLAVNCIECHHSHFLVPTPDQSAV